MQRSSSSSLVEDHSFSPYTATNWTTTQEFVTRTLANDHARKWVNSVMNAFVSVELGGNSVEHPGIRFNCCGLYLKDKVHFTNRGNDIFLKSISQSLEVIIQSGWN